MHGLVTALCLALTLAPCGATALGEDASSRTPPVLESTYGTLLGFAGEETGTPTHGKVDAFLGIPYATAPVGDLRFLPPTPPAAWTGTRNATQYGASCLQTDDPAPETGAGLSEDCLSINVWRPFNASGPLPVMLYIHGGSYEAGSGTAKWYNGKNLSTSQNVIVATINYRLGLLGWSVLDEVPGFNETRPDASNGGMNGIKDMTAALQWVHDNGDALGADLDKVTVFGESAGSIATSTLAQSPPAAGLFQRGIFMSGTVTSPYWGNGGPQLGRDAMRLTLPEIAGQPFDKLSLEALQELPGNYFVPYGLLGSGYVDGVVVPFCEDAATNEAVGGCPMERYLEGKVHVDAVITSATSVDGTSPWEDYYSTTGPLIPSGGDNVAYEEALDNWWAEMASAYGPGANVPTGAEVAKTYPLSDFDDQATPAFMQADGDACVACPSLKVGRILADLGVQTWNMAFHYGASTDDVGAEAGLYQAVDPDVQSDGWATHTADILWAFDATRGGPDPLDFSTTSAPLIDEWSAGRQALVEGMQNAYGSFARGENPTPPAGLGAASWPKVDGSGGVADQSVMVFDAPAAALVTGYRAEVCEWWGSHNSTARTLQARVAEPWVRKAREGARARRVARRAQQ